MKKKPPTKVYVVADEDGILRVSHSAEGIQEIQASMNYPSVIGVYELKNLVKIKKTITEEEIK